MANGKRLDLELDFLFSESTTAISYHNSDGVFLKVNPAYCSLFGYAAEELIGNEFTVLFPNLDQGARNKLLEQYKEFYNLGQNNFREDSIFSKEGELKTIEISSKFAHLSDDLKVCVSFITDISKYKQSNEKILNAVFNALSGVIYHARIDSCQKRKMIFMSDRADLMFGYTGQEIQKDISLIANVLHPEDIITPSQSIEIFKRNNNFRRLEYRVKNKSGGWKWLEERSILIERENSEYDLYGMITDITESKASNKKLEDLRFALDQSSIISITDKDGVILDINERFSKVSGYSREEILGANHRILNSGYHPTEFFKDMWDTISSGQVWQGEIRNKRKNGKLYWVYSSIVPFLDEHKKPFQYISIRHEITQRKEAEEKLAASEEKYRLLYENAPIGIVIVDPNAKILECNNYLLKMLGYSKEELVGQASFKFLHEDFIEYKKSALQKLFSGEIKRFYIEEKRRTKDGSYVWVGCYSNAIIGEEGDVVYRLDFVTDIENRKKGEEELLKLDQSKNAILNIVAHDLRTPIVGITNLARLLLKKPMDDECRKFLDLIESSGNHALHIIQDILEITQLEHETEIFEMESVELNLFIKECIKIHEIHGKEKSIQIQFKSSIEKIYHNINRDKMERVLSNLISNAIKFSYERNKIEIFLYRKNQKTVIQIQDHGVGIPEDLLGSIFDKFGQARRVGTKGESSIGLGMSIVKEIIDKHKAKIKVESEEQKGTSVYIEL